MPKQEPSGKVGPKTKSRRHGYRGYGSPLRPTSDGGAVHWGRGFSGVGFPGEEGSILPPAPEVASGERRVKESRKDSSKKK